MSTALPGAQLVLGMQKGVRSADALFVETVVARLEGELAMDLKNALGYGCTLERTVGAGGRSVHTGNVSVGGRSQC